ncbi:MAG TPA: hydrolase [Clostridiales bacterium]|nr:hydrolase [Clostridiales bacterium]
MGKFDGVMLFTDYDDTLYNSSHTVSRENKAAIRHFMEQGGRFSIATGRAHRTFTPQICKEGLEFNAPVVLSNGAAVYDYQAQRYLKRTYLPDGAPQLLAQLCAQTFPELGFEAYHQEDIYVHNPNQVTQIHLERVGAPYIQCPIQDMPTPWVKVILEQDHPYLQQVQAHLLAHWQEGYEVIFSNPYLLEVTAKGSNKGAMVAWIAQQYGIAPQNLYCIGDNQNDLPMLSCSAIPFAPANCAQAVRDWGATILGHCDEHAVAQAIECLEARYSG